MTLEPPTNDASTLPAGDLAAAAPSVEHSAFPEPNFGGATPVGVSPRTNWFLIGAFFLVIAVAAAGYWAWDRNKRYTAKESFHAEAVRLMTHASRADMDSAIGDRGVVLTAKDGGWIAIRYGGSDEEPVWSESVARDSSGAWLTCERRFDRSLRMYQADKLRRDEDLGAGSRRNGPGPISCGATTIAPWTKSNHAPRSTRHATVSRRWDSTR